MTRKTPRYHILYSHLQIVEWTLTMISLIGTCESKRWDRDLAEAFTWKHSSKISNTVYSQTNETSALYKPYKTTPLRIWQFYLSKIQPQKQLSTRNDVLNFTLKKSSKCMKNEPDKNLGAISYETLIQYLYWNATAVISHGHWSRPYNSWTLTGSANTLINIKVIQARRAHQPGHTYQPVGYSFVQLGIPRIILPRATGTYLAFHNTRFSVSMGSVLKAY